MRKPKKPKKLTQMDIIKSIRKKMPPPTKVIIPDREVDKNWDWRKEISKGENHEETDN